VTVIGIDHVQLAMPAGQEDEARRFYSHLLGIGEVAKPAALAKRGGVWFESGGARIHLGVEANFRPARKAHPALLVKNLPALLDRLRNAGVAIVDAESIAGRRRVHVSDPFGNRVELMEGSE